MHVCFYDRVKLISGCCPNKSMKRMVEKGEKLLNLELDLMGMIKRSKYHQFLLSDHVHHKNEIKDILNIDEDSESDNSYQQSGRNDSKPTISETSIIEQIDPKSDKFSKQITAMR